MSAETVAEVVGGVEVMAREVVALRNALTESQAEVARLRAALVVDVWQDANEAEYPDAPEFERECAYRKGWNDCAFSVYRAALEPTR